MSRDYSAADFDFSVGIKVRSSAQKFVIVIPRFDDGGEPLVHPDGPKAGEPIKNWEGKLIGERGVIFWNPTDATWQAAPGDGTGVIIINQATSEQADRYAAEIRSQGEPLTLAGLKRALEAIGAKDIYNSDRASVALTMIPIGGEGDRTGLFRRDDKFVSPAVRLVGSGTFQGPAVTPQVFLDGAVIVKTGDKARLVQPDVFLATYRKADGSPFESLSDVPAANVPAGGFSDRLRARAASSAPDAPDEGMAGPSPR